MSTASSAPAPGAIKGVMPLFEVGRKAPAFTLRDQEEKPHSLKDYRGRPVILFFYPQDDTPGCTVEACEFRDLFPKFNAGKAAVLGISPDDEASHARFAAKYGLNFTLLADVPGKDGLPPVCSAYGVWQEREYQGKKFIGVARTTYLIDAKGNVARRWDNVKVKGHAEEVLAAVKELEK